MAMRVTGMNSGLDTETIIQELVKAKKDKGGRCQKGAEKARMEAGCMEGIKQ